jgi:hypothetical protein
VIKKVYTRDRPEEHFLHVFRLAEGTFETALPHGYMPDFLKLRSLYARFREDDYYESQTLARDLYARPVLEGWHWDCRDLSPSLAFELLGLLCSKLDLRSRTCKPFWQKPPRWPASTALFLEQKQPPLPPPQQQQQQQPQRPQRQRRQGHKSHIPHYESWLEDP